MAAEFASIENRLRKIAAQNIICLFFEVFLFLFVGFFFGSQLGIFFLGSIWERERLYYIFISNVLTGPFSFNDICGLL